MQDFQVTPDPVAQKSIERLIESNLMKTPAEAVYQFSRNGSGIHVNLIKKPDDGKIYLIASSADGVVDVIEKGKQSPYKQL